MEPRDFCYWLQGFLELHGDNTVSMPQVKMIREHLATVFEKRTPPLKTLPELLQEQQEAQIQHFGGLGDRKIC